MDRIVRKKSGEGFRPGRLIPVIGLSSLFVFVLIAFLLSVTTGGALAAGNATDGGSAQENVLNDGDAVVIGGGMVKKISLSQAPAQLLKALDSDDFTGSSSR